MTIFKASQRPRDGALPPKVSARRNKLLGAWAAAHMGLTGEDAARYAMSIVEVGTNGEDDKAIARKVCEDLVARGFPIVERDVSHLLHDFLAKARIECPDEK